MALKAQDSVTVGPPMIVAFCAPGAQHRMINCLRLCGITLALWLDSLWILLSSVPNSSWFAWGPSGFRTESFVSQEPPHPRKQDGFLFIDQLILEVAIAFHVYQGKKGINVLKSDGIAFILEKERTSDAWYDTNEP